MGVVVFKITRSFGDIPFEVFLKEEVERIAKEKFGITLEITNIEIDREKLYEALPETKLEEKSS